MQNGSWVSIIVIYCYGILAVASTGKVPPVIGQIAGEFGVSRANIGWVISAAILAAAVAGGTCGAMIDRLGRRRTLAASCLLIFVSSLGAVACSSYRDLLILRFVEGIGYLGVIVVAPVMLMETTTGIRQVKALVLWSTLFPVGYAFGLLLGALAAELGGGWRLSFELHAGLGALLAAITVLLPPSAAAKQLGDQWARMRAALREPRPVRVALAQAAYAFGTVGAGTVLPLYLSVTHKLSIAQTSSVIAVASLSFSAIGSLLGGVLLIRGLSMRLVFLIGIALNIISMLVLFMPDLAFESIAVAIFFWHLATGMTITVIMTLVPRVVSGPEALGGANGLLYQAGALGSLVGPVAFFQALASGSWISLAALGIVAGLCVLIAPVWRLSLGLRGLPVHGLARTVGPKR